jgi:hypothetical protein
MPSDSHDAYYVVAVAQDGPVAAGRCVAQLDLADRPTACVTYRGETPAAKATAARDAIALVMSPRRAR